MALLILLKIAGIFVLVLLVCLLLVVLLLLTVPFRYELSEKSRGKMPEGKLVLSWLWKGIFLRLDADPCSAVTGELKLFGYRYLRICYRFVREEEGIVDDTEDAKVPEETSYSIQSLNSLFDDAKENETIPSETAEAGEEEDNTEDAKLSERIRNRRRQRRDRLEVFLQDCVSFLKSGTDKLIARLKEDLEKLKSSSAGLAGKLKELLDLFKSGEYRTSVKLLKEQVFRILKELLPRSGKGAVEYGAGDPFTTGKILEVLAFFYPLYGKTFQITPYFEEKKLDTDITVQGRICLGVILICLGRTVLDKGIRKLAGETRRIIRES